MPTTASHRRGPGSLDTSRSITGSAVDRETTFANGGDIEAAEATDRLSWWTFRISLVGSFGNTTQGELPKDGYYVFS